MSKRCKHFERTNRNRWCWLTMAHHERLRSYYARAGRFYLAELAEQGVTFWRQQLGVEP